MSTIMNKVGASALAMVFAVSAISANPASATTIGELQALIAQLTAQIAALSTGTSATVTTTTTGYVHAGVEKDFTFSLLRVGSKGEEVKALQKVINTSSDGNFGPGTKASLMAWQKANGLFSDGIAGAASKAELNKKTTVTVATEEEETATATATSVSGDKLVISGMDSDDMTIGNAQTVIFTELTLEAGDEDVMVKDLIIEYVGSANRSMIEKVILLDSAMVELDSDTIDSDDEAKIEVDMEIKDGESLTLYVAAKTVVDVSGNNGLDVSFTVTSVKTNGSDVEGTPVNGAVHELNSAFGVDTFDAVISQDESGSVKIGEEGVKVATINVESNSSDDSAQTVKAIKLELTGTGNEDSIDNVVIVVDGKTYEGTEKDEEYTFDLGNGIELEEDGDDKDFVISVDVADDATKTFGFNVLSVVVTDEDGSLLTDGTATYDYSAFLTIDVSEVAISKNTDVQSEKVAAGANSVELSSFDVEVTGKDVEGDVEVTIVVSADIEAADGVAGPVAIKDVDLDNVAIYTANGDRVSDKEDTAFSITPVDGTSDQATYVLTLDNVTFEEGQDAEDYVIKADINSDAPTDTKYEITQIKYVSIEDEDGEDITNVTETIATPAEIEVESATIAVSVEDADEQDVNSDKDNIVVGKIKLDADNSGDNVNVSQIKLAYTLEELKEVFTVTFAGNETGSDTTIAFDGDTITLAATDATGILIANKFEAGYTETTHTSVDNTDGTITFTQKTASDLTDVVTADFVVTPGSPDATAVTATVATPTTQGSDADLDDVRQCELFNGSASVSDAETAAASVTYNVDIDVTKDTEVSLTVQCDMGSDFNNGNKVTVTGTNFDAKGIETNLDLDTSITGATTATITDGSTELTLSSDDTNDAKVVKDDEDGVVLGNYDFKAKDAALVIDDVTVTFDATVATEFDGKVDIYVNGVKEDSVTPSTTAVFTNLSINVDKDETVIIEFKADMDLAGSANIASVSMTTEEGVAVTTESSTGPIVTIVAAVPVVTQVNNDISDLGTDNDVVLFAYTVKADGGDIVMLSTDLDVTLNNADITNVSLAVYDNADMVGSAEYEITLADEAGASVSYDVNDFDDGAATTVAISENDVYYVFLVADVNATGDTRSIRVQMTDDVDGVVFSTPNITGEKLMEGDMKSLLKQD